MHPTTSASPPLSRAQLARFHDDGFLIVEGMLPHALLVGVMEEIAGMVDRLASALLRAGRISETFAGEGFLTRLTLLDRAFPGAAVLIHMRAAAELGPALQALWSHPRLLDLVGQLLGPEIAGHPVYNVRSKTPTNPLATVPWHQDTAYLAAGCDGTLQPTAWVPLIDVTGRHGTLQVVRGGHRHGVLRHRLENAVGDRRSWYLYVADEDLPRGEVVTCEMPLGSFLLLNQLTPHRSTENLSHEIRWSVDLRWQRPSDPSGTEGMKDPIVMRTARDPAHCIPWMAWATQDRLEAGRVRAVAKDEFDIAVEGPWLERWR